MADEPSQLDDLNRLLEKLHSQTDKPVPQGGIRRVAKTARVAFSTGIGMLSGRFKKTGADGLGAVDLATISKLVENLGELKGMAMKMGQILGYLDEGLPEETRKLLALLQTQSQPMPFEQLTQAIEEGLGPRAASLLVRLNPDPVAVASIGQVHRSQLPDGTQVAVKVRHPGIDTAIRADFKLARIGPAMTRLFVPSAAGSVKEMVAEAQARLLEECDYRLEAQRQRAFGELFAEHPDLRVPTVHPNWVAERVLTTTWMTGLGLDAFLESRPDQVAIDRAGKTLFEFYFGSLYRAGLFHADPHPGNYVFDPDGRVTVFDFGCVRRYDSATVQALASLAHEVVHDHESSLREAMRALGIEPPKKAKHYVHVRKLLRGFFAPLLRPGPRAMEPGTGMEAGQIMRDKRALMRLRLPGKLLFLFRIRFGLFSILARMGAVCDWAALELELAQQADGWRDRADLALERGIVHKHAPR